MTLNSYPSIYNLGHSALTDLFSDPVLIQEKLDGSQFSFGLRFRTGYGGDLALYVRSKGVQWVIAEQTDGVWSERAVSQQKMFESGEVEVYNRKNMLEVNWTYRGEYFQKPKHNTLAYDRIPVGHIALFDIDKGLEDYMYHEDLNKTAKMLGFEAVSTLFHGYIPASEEGLDKLTSILSNTESALGGTTIEGVVIKNYYKYGPDKKALMGKFVREDFKEKNNKNWKEGNPNKKDFIISMGEVLRTEARWAKAVQHLREKGELADSPRDIGALIQEVQNDIVKEEEDWIKKKLWDWAKPLLMKDATRGLPEWYKERLMEKQFESNSSS